MALLLALHSSLAGWVLTQATAVQALEIFERYRPSVNRN